MVARSAAPISSHQLDIGVLFFLRILQLCGIVVVLLLAGLTFLHWTVPILGDTLPDFFKLMRANNAFLGLVCGLSLLLLQPQRSASSVRAGQLCGIFVILFAGLLLASDFGWIGLEINTLFAQDPTHVGHGRVSPEAAFTYVLLGLVLATMRTRARPFSYLADFFAFFLCLTMANFLASYILGLSQLFTIDPKNPFALQTYILLTVLTFVACSCRAEFGLFAVLLSRRVGGQFARLAAPLALFLPFAFVLSDAPLTHAGALPDSVMTARFSSLVSLVAFCLVVFLAFRTERLESRMEELILRDDLTRLYNRRGFSLLAETSLRLAQREKTSFFVLLLDLDGLKRINRISGHRAGSDCLCQIAHVLQQTFDETALTARIGGDEFAVAGKANSAQALELVREFQAATLQTTKSSGEPVAFTCSFGSAFSKGDRSTSLTSLIEKAERSLLETKRAKLYAC